MSTGIRNTVIVLVYTGLESSCKDWKQYRAVLAYEPVSGLESSCKDWKQEIISRDNLEHAAA